MDDLGSLIEYEFGGPDKYIEKEHSNAEPEFHKILAEVSEKANCVYSNYHSHNLISNQLLIYSFPGTNTLARVSQIGLSISTALFRYKIIFTNRDKSKLEQTLSSLESLANIRTLTRQERKRFSLC